MFSGGDGQPVLGRRRLLATVGSVAVAGCGLRSSPVRIAEITAQNWRETAHTVAVELRSEDEVVFDATASLSPAEYADGDPEQPTGRTWRPEAEFTAEATLRYRTDSGEWQSVTLGDDGNECIRPQIELRSGGRSVVGRRYECFGTETE